MIFRKYFYECPYCDSENVKVLNVIEKGTFIYECCNCKKTFNSKGFHISKKKEGLR